MTAARILSISQILHRTFSLSFFIFFNRVFFSIAHSNAICMCFEIGNHDNSDKKCLQIVANHIIFNLLHNSSYFMLSNDKKLQNNSFKILVQIHSEPPGFSH